MSQRQNRKKIGLTGYLMSKTPVWANSKPSSSVQVYINASEPDQS